MLIILPTLMLVALLAGIAAINERDYRAKQAAERRANAATCNYAQTGGARVLR